MIWLVYNCSGARMLMCNLSQNPNARCIVARNLPTLLTHGTMWCLRRPQVLDQDDDEERMMLGRVPWWKSLSLSYIWLCHICFPWAAVTAAGTPGRYGHSYVLLCASSSSSGPNGQKLQQFSSLSSHGVGSKWCTVQEACWQCSLVLFFATFEQCTWTWMCFRVTLLVRSLFFSHSWF